MLTVEHKQIKQNHPVRTCKKNSLEPRSAVGVDEHCVLYQMVVFKWTTFPELLLINLIGSSM